MALGLKKKTAAKPQRIEKPKAVPTPPTAPVVSGSLGASMAPAPRPFTARELAFMDRWMVSRNASDAARKAGYSKHTAKEQGARLLTKVHVRAELDRRIAAERQRLQLSAEWVTERLMRIADASIGNYMRDGGFDLTDMTAEEAYALDAVTIEEFKDGRSDKREVRRVKLSLGDRVKSLELLGKRLKLWNEDAPMSDPRETLTLLGLMMREIDAADRRQGMKVIEHAK